MKPTMLLLARAMRAWGRPAPFNGSVECRLPWLDTQAREAANAHGSCGQWSILKCINPSPPRADPTLVSLVVTASQDWMDGHVPRVRRTVGRARRGEMLNWREAACRASLDRGEFWQGCHGLRCCCWLTRPLSKHPSLATAPAPSL